MRQIEHVTKTTHVRTQTHQTSNSLHAETTNSKFVNVGHHDNFRRKMIDLKLNDVEKRALETAIHNNLFQNRHKFVAKDQIHKVCISFS